MGGGCGRVGLDPLDGRGGAGVAAGTGGAPRGTGGARGTGGVGAGGAGTGGAGVGGESGSCSDLGAADCQRRHGCAYYVCNCRGTGVCTTPQSTPPACECPLNCSFLDEATCQSRSSVCRTDYCPTCGGAQTFAGCAFMDAPPPMCIAPPCPPPLPCAQETTRDACDRRTDCHSVPSSMDRRSATARRGTVASRSSAVPTAARRCAAPANPSCARRSPPTAARATASPTSTAATRAVSPPRNAPRCPAADWRTGSRRLRGLAR